MSWIKKNQNTIIAIAILIAVALFYFRPLLSGNQLVSHDNLAWKYISHEAREYAKATGEITAWSNCMFGGMPNYTFFTNVKTSIFRNLYDFTNNYIFAEPLMYFVIGLILMYVLLSLTRLSIVSKVVLSMAGTFVSYSAIITAAGHNTKMFTIALFPGILAGVLMVYAGKRWKGILTLLITLGLVLAVGMQQIEYYMAFVFGAVGVSEFIKSIQAKQLTKWLANTGIILAIFGLSLTSSLFNFTPLLEYNKYTMRGGNSELTLNKDDKDKDKKGGLDKDYAFSWSNSWGESLTTLVPFLYGGASGEPLPEDSRLGETLVGLGVPYQSIEQITSQAPTYWGDQPFVSGPIYFGAVIMFLFVLALLYYRHRSKWWIVASILITFFISLGDHFKAFNYFMFDHFPLFNNFRSPTMVLSLTFVLVMYLASISLYHFIHDKKDQQEKLKKLYLATGIVGGLSLIIALMGSSLFSFSSTNDAQVQQQYMQAFQNEQAVNQVMSALKSDRAAMASASAWRSLIFILLSAGLLYAYLKEYLKTKYIIAVVALLAFIDNIGIANKYLNEDKYVSQEEYDAIFYPRQVDQQIMQDTDPYYRVLDVSVNVFNEAKPAYFHRLIGGYSAAKMESYQDLIDMQLGGEKTGGKWNSEVLNMLNTKYIITPEQQAVRRPTANGNGWFVENIKWVKNADEEMLALNAPAEGDTSRTTGGFDSKNVAIMQDKDLHKDLKGYQFGRSKNAKIQLTKYGLPHLSYTTTNDQDGMAVFSEIYYPAGWNAYLDDKQVPIYKADYLLRAVKIPKGNHTLEFRFEPKTLKSAMTFSLIGSILAVLLIGFSVVRIFRSHHVSTAEIADEI